jgi:hypothetical protein
LVLMPLERAVRHHARPRRRPAANRRTARHEPPRCRACCQADPCAIIDAEGRGSFNLRGRPSFAARSAPR